MFSLPRSFALTGAALAASLAMACSSSPESTPPSTAPSTTPTPGPLSGTYSADSLDGTAPFVAITFLDPTHYSYVSRSCFAAPAGAATDGSAGDDTGDPVADHGAAPSYDADPTDGGCIHGGTYGLTATALTLTDDDGSAVVTLPLGELAADGTEVTDPSAAATGGSSLVGGNTLIITINIQLLFGQKSVSSLLLGGTAMRRTGLVDQAGVGSACTIGDGTAGTCRLTSTCAEEGNTSTPNYCPGPDDVQCCTKKSKAPAASNNAVSRAQQWVAVKMPYCEAANGAHDGDSSCSSTCTRTGAANTSAWNPYRSDCSGLVSWAWDLSAPGLTTWEFVPGAATFIPQEDLQPGDALLRPSEHVVLFDHWIDKSTGTADVISEPGCAAGAPPYAQHQTWSLGRSPGSASPANWGGATYYATRKRG